ADVRRARGGDRAVRIVRTVGSLREALGTDPKAAGTDPEAVGTDPTGTRGLVPTMGAFHAGHVALFEAARAENELVVASLFVNPAQFGAREDFARYPRDEKRDEALAEHAG